MSAEVLYEIWGLDDPLSDATDGEFRESCETFEEAILAKHEWQTGGRAAWIRRVE